jgi:hypothetical protein
LFGVCARKVGAGGNLTLLALPFWLAEGGALVWAVDEGTGAVAAVALVMSAVFLVEAWLFGARRCGRCAASAERTARHSAIKFPRFSLASPRGAKIHLAARQK